MAEHQCLLLGRVVEERLFAGRSLFRQQVKDRQTAWMLQMERQQNHIRNMEQPSCLWSAGLLRQAAQEVEHRSHLGGGVFTTVGFTLGLRQ